MSRWWYSGQVGLKQLWFASALAGPWASGAAHGENPMALLGFSTKLMPVSPFGFLALELPVLRTWLGFSWRPILVLLRMGCHPWVIPSKDSCPPACPCILGSLP